ncbi:MAG: sulfotransferase family protein [Bacteroidota bacterium]
MIDQKIFCVGFHKTGTTSLQLALEELGYRVTGPNGHKNPNIANEVLEMAHKLVPQFDAFQDNPWPIIFKEMDKAYPNSKFILTIRDTNSWIKSQVKHFGIHKTPMREWIYGVGCPKGNEQVYIKRYEQHNEQVRNYFKDRPEDLLVMNLPAGDGWEKLCPFLGHDLIKEPFPHANKASNRNKSRSIIHRFLKSSKSKIVSLKKAIKTNP